MLSHVKRLMAKIHNAFGEDGVRQPYKLTSKNELQTSM
jgi:hypothetical protein